MLKVMHPRRRGEGERVSQDKVGVVRGAPCVRPESFFAAPAVAAVAVAHRCCRPRLAP